MNSFSHTTLSGNGEPVTFQPLIPNFDGKSKKLFVYENEATPVGK